MPHSFSSLPRCTITTISPKQTCPKSHRMFVTESKHSQLQEEWKISFSPRCPPVVLISRREISLSSLLPQLDHWDSCIFCLYAVLECSFFKIYRLSTFFHHLSSSNFSLKIYIYIYRFCLNSSTLNSIAVSLIYSFQTFSKITHCVTDVAIDLFTELNT